MKKNSSIAFQILALGEIEEAKLLTIVDEVINYVKSEVEEVHVGPFETTLVGEFDHLMSVLVAAIKKASVHHNQIFSNVKINYKAQGEVLGVEEKTSQYR